MAIEPTMRLLSRPMTVLGALFLLVACGSEGDAEEISDEARPIEHEERSNGEAVTPPFEVRGEAEGLLLVWFDGQGTHPASKRSDIPEAHRAQVRVDSLRLSPDQRLDPDYVYVADLRRAAAGGRYAVRKIRRESFEAMIDGAARAANAIAQAEERANAAHGAGAASPGAGGTVDPNADVIIYGASWCGACRSAASYFHQRQVAFVEKDIERDPGARDEMNARVRAAGLAPSGSIPVIDFRGRVMQGFDPGEIDRLIAATPATPATPARPRGRPI